MAKKHLNRGFTLVELLVAATIIGFLAIFATNSYRGGVAETRWAQAKAKLDQLAIAVKRVRLDYPNVVFNGDAVSNAASSTCSFNPNILMPAGYSPALLIECDYLENGDWNSEYFEYFVCDSKANSPCISYNSTAPVACVGVRSSAKVPAKYKNYTYCFYSNLGGVENPA